jgi:hypothetical protein
MAKSAFELLQESSSLPDGHTAWDYLNNIETIIYYGLVEMSLCDSAVEMSIPHGNEIDLIEDSNELLIAEDVSEILISESSNIFVDSIPDYIILEVCDE